MGVDHPLWRNESEDSYLYSLVAILNLLQFEAQQRPVYASIVGEAEREHTLWDPKDGELCLGRTKPEETLVEVRSDSDVQIDRQTWV